MIPNRLQALGVLVVVFAAGLVAGAAIDRALLRPRTEPRTERRPSRGAEIEADRIPMPLAALGLSPDEERRLHEIARRWRPQTARAIEGIRATVSDLENDMFAEMLCALSKDKVDRYLAQLQENGAPPALIEKRTRLVRSNQCPNQERR